MQKYAIGTKFKWQVGYERNNKVEIVCYDPVDRIYSLEFTNNDSGNRQVNSTSWTQEHIDVQLIFIGSSLESYVLNKLKENGYGS